MGVVWLIIAAVLLVAGIVLLVVDRRRRAERADPRTSDPFAPQVIAPRTPKPSRHRLGG